MSTSLENIISTTTTNLIGYFKLDIFFAIFFAVILFFLLFR